jgi:hypothetical protein
MESPYDSSDWRRRYLEKSGDGSGWILAAVIAAVVVVGLLAFGMNETTTTATGPSATETTSQATRSAPAPKPNNPAPPATTR